MQSISGSFDLPSYADYVIMDKLLLSSVDIFSSLYAELFKKYPAGSLTTLCNFSLNNFMGQ